MFLLHTTMSLDDATHDNGSEYTSLGCFVADH